MLDHWWLIRAAQISFFPPQPVSAAPPAGPWEEGELRTIPSASSPPTCKHTDFVIHRET